MSTQQASTFRLVTRSDFDGLVCGALLKHLGLIDDITFVHPKDMQDGKIEIDANDITTNLPYVPGCHLAFDHHLSETVRNVERADNHIINADAPSAARVVCHTNVGELCLSYGGGHLNASICQVDNDQAESALTEIVERINADG